MTPGSADEARRPVDSGGIAAALAALGEGPAEGDVSCGEIVDRLGVRSFGLAMLLLALPNLTPGPSIPGFSTIFGLPMALLALQMLAGAPSPRLPRFIAERRISRAAVRRFLAHALPIVARIDRVLRPRLVVVAEARGLAALGLLLEGVLLSLPLPVVSMAAGLGALLIAVGLLARDGLVLLAGQIVGLVTAGLYVAAIWGLLAAWHAVAS